MKKKILQLISSTGFFGAEKVMLQLSSSLCASGYEVYVGVLGNNSGSHMEVARAAEKNGLRLKIFDCRGKFDLETIRMLRKFIKKEQIDIVHSHGYKSNLYGLTAAYALDAKKVTTCHNWLSSEIKMKIYEIIDKLMLRSFDKVIAVSENLSKEILVTGIFADKVVTIANGIDILKYSSGHQSLELKKAFGLEDKDLIIGAVGRLSEEKGHEYLIKAFKNVAEKLPNCKLMIVGDGTLRESLEVLVRSLEIEDKVIFTGIRDDIPELLKIMDLFVLPSLDEEMPLALLEAMAAGVPIVATAVGAVPSVIADQHLGKVVKPKDVRCITEAAIELLQNSEKAHRCAQAAFDEVVRRFSLKAMVDKYESAYCSILSG